MNFLFFSKDSSEFYTLKFSKNQNALFAESFHDMIVRSDMCVIFLIDIVTTIRSTMSMPQYNSSDQQWFIVVHYHKPLNAIIMITFMPPFAHDPLFFYMPMKHVFNIFWKERFKILNNIESMPLSVTKILQLHCVANFLCYWYRKLTCISGGSGAGGNIFTAANVSYNVS